MEDTFVSTLGSKLASSKITFRTVFGDALILQLSLTIVRPQAGKKVVPKQTADSQSTGTLDSWVIR